MRHYEYIGILTGTSVVVTALLVVACGSLLDLLDKKKDGAGWLPSLSLLPFIFAAPLSFLVSTHLLHIAPPVIPSDSVHSESSAHIAELEFQANQLATILDPSELSTKEARLALAGTGKILTELRSLIAEREQDVAQLTWELENEKARAEAALRLMQKEANLTEKELEAVTSLVTEEGKKKSAPWVVLGFVFSFPLGVLSSLIASRLFRLFGSGATSGNSPDEQP